ncbi:hypothetical protein BKA70DRAFT_1256321 [Coprinopsis sp. MPI-PUGE-AT-0042]|nr:hypothetical protein BKA70DRAFT_1256321 [Coprinopsis sp. MPI-PUGE-AT-0042]
MHCASAPYSSTRCSSFQGSISCFLSLSSSVCTSGIIATTLWRRTTTSQLASGPPFRSLSAFWFSLLSTSFSLLTLKLPCDRTKKSRAETKKGNGDLVRSWPSCYFSSP